MAGESCATTVETLIGQGELLINDGYRAKNSELSPTGIPFARAGNIDNGFHFADADCFPVENLDRVGFKVSQPGDVVFTSKGTVGRFAFVVKDTPRFVYAPQLCFWRSLNHERINPRWLYYWMQGREFFLQYKGVAGQTDMAEYVSLRDQRRMHITLPPAEDQRAIAHVLGTLDDKIELNRRMNETLEAMARALFKSWFVDFDPVRAKRERSQPAGMDKATAALFPDSFQDSPLGKIPKGWRACRWGDIATLEYGKSLRSYEDSAGPYRVYGTNGPIGWHTDPLCATSGIVIGRKGAYRGVHYSRHPFFVIDTAFYLKPIRTFDLKWAYYELLAFDINSMDSGSAIPSTSREDFYRIPVCLPPEAVMCAFGERLEPLFCRTEADQGESKTLAALRDALLPKLLSGKIRVPDAERFMGRCV